MLAPYRKKLENRVVGAGNAAPVSVNEAVARLAEAPKAWDGKGKFEFLRMMTLKRR